MPPPFKVRSKKLTLCCSLCAVQRPFCVGLTLESLHAQSTDEDWNPTFLKTNEQIIHKVWPLFALFRPSCRPQLAYVSRATPVQLVSLKNFAIYWNSDDSFVDASNTRELRDKLDALVRQPFGSLIPFLSSSKCGLTGPALDVSTRTACAQAPLHHATHHQRVEGTLREAGKSLLTSVGSPKLAISPTRCC